jgi:hypothetical protein
MGIMKLKINGKYSKRIEKVASFKKAGTPQCCEVPNANPQTHEGGQGKVAAEVQETRSLQRPLPMVQLLDARTGNCLKMKSGVWATCLMSLV